MRMRSIFLMALLLLVGATVGAYVVATTPFVGAQNQVDTAAVSAAIGTAFTYQGRLTDKGNPANGSYDFVFELYDAETGGTQVGNTVTRDDIEVVDGYFSVQLDFGNVFTNEQRYLEIGVRPGTSNETYHKLSPRRPIMPAPWAGAIPGLTMQGGTLTIAGAVVTQGDLKMRSPDGTKSIELVTGGAAVDIVSYDHTLTLKGGTNNECPWKCGNILLNPFGPNPWGGYGNVGIGTVNPLAKLDVNGNVNVSGMVSKSGGSFKIDHPLDPTSKYLYHSFVESPDMMNIYNGNVTLDANGEAWVQMPEWFEALNQEFRYQLTSIGAPGPNLYIAQAIADNRFQIAGGAAGATVSWQVTGIRHDPYAEANRIPVEEEKPTAEVGTYLHPEVYGAPAEQGVYFQRPESSLAE